MLHRKRAIGNGRPFLWKLGCEETFLNALKPVIEEGSYLTWVGEEGEVWEMVF